MGEEGFLQHLGVSNDMVDEKWMNFFFFSSSRYNIAYGFMLWSDPNYLEYRCSICDQGRVVRKLIALCSMSYAAYLCLVKVECLSMLNLDATERERDHRMNAYMCYHW